MVLPAVSAEENYTRISIGWQERYNQVLENYAYPSGQVIKDDSAYICDRAILPTGDSRWPNTRYRRWLDNGRHIEVESSLALFNLGKRHP